MPTVRKIISVDEWYPVYEIYDSSLGRFVDIPEELIEEFERISDEFENMQEILSGLYEKGIAVKEVAKW